MKALFCSTHPLHTADFFDDLQAALPALEFIHWRHDMPSQGAQIAVIFQPPAELYAREPDLRAVFNLGAGVDALLSNPAFPSTLELYRLEDGGMSAQIAEYVVHAISRIVRGFDLYAEHQSGHQWRQLTANDRQDFPVGILGLGVIGRKIATTLADLGYCVAGWSRSGQPLTKVEVFGGPTQLDAFLARSRIVVNILPLTPDTAGILNARNLGRLITPAHVINVGRGEHLVEDDLLEVMASGHVKSAYLDVFCSEPLPQDHPFWSHPGISVTPHIAAQAVRRESMAQIASKIEAYMAGQNVSGRVSRMLGY
jgi:glyoxylate/hydroxypyruvate reductase A